MFVTLPKLFLSIPLEIFYTSAFYPCDICRYYFFHRAARGSATIVEDEESCHGLKAQ